MRTNRKIGWKIFACLMAVLVIVGDFPKLANPTAHHPLQIALLPVYAIVLLGLWQYSFGWPRRPSSGFWRVFAPFFALVTAASVGFAIPPIIVVASLLSGSVMGVLGMLIGLGLPAAIVTYTIIALLRLGDWIGPTRRPVGERPPQLSLPL